MNNRPVFSIIVIGYNTSTELISLLGSINNILYNKNDVEIVYVDDGSTDNSLELFQNYNLKFKKTSFGFVNNLGRNSARNKGVELATGEWLLFLNSNVIVNQDIICSYQQLIQQPIVAIGGTIKYKTKDVSFQKHLNHPCRGINQYNQGDIIKYNYLLFGNCMVKRSALKTTKFNNSLKSYGGEELEFSYRLSQQNPEQFIACIDAVVTRYDHPDLLSHCKRLENFGKENYKKLNIELQHSIIKYPLLIKQNIVLKYCIRLVGVIFTWAYKNGLQYRKIIQILLLAGLLRGIHNTHAK